MRKIFNRFFNKKEENNQGFFVYDLLAKEEENNIQNSSFNDEAYEEHSNTVFERVLISQRSQKKDFKYRYAVIGGIAAVLLVLIIIFGHFMSVYKKNAPATLCEEIVLAYENNTPDLFVKYCTNIPKVLKNKDNLKEYFNAYMPKNTFNYYQVAAENKSEQKYIFKSGDMKIGEIIFKKQKKNAAYGIDKYKVKSFEITPLVEYRFNAYSSFTLLINGIPADDYLFSKNTALDNFVGVLEQPVTKDMYIINDVNFVKELKARDFDGQVYDVVSSINNFGYDLTVECEEKKEELAEYFKNFVFEYMHYTVKDDSKPQPVLDYIKEGTYIFDEIKKYVNWDITRYENERIENFALSDLVYYGSGLYTCRVSADYVTEVKKETVAKNFNKTISLMFNDGKYYIVDMIEYIVD